MTVTDLHSIQAEQAIENWGPKADLRMDDDDVEEYVAGQSDEVNRCRARGRHLYDAQESRAPIFSDITPEGLWVRKLRCECCGLVGRVESWESKRVGKSGRRWKFVSARPDYSLRGPKGEKYLADPGHGRMAPRQVKGAVVSNLMHGQNITQLRAEVKRRAEDERKAHLEAVKAKYAAAEDADHTADDDAGHTAETA